MSESAERVLIITEDPVDPPVTETGSGYTFLSGSGWYQTGISCYFYPAHDMDGNQLALYSATELPDPLGLFRYIT